MSSPTCNNNLEITTLNTVVKIENLNYISRFGLSSSIVQHIYLCLIFHNISINNSTITLDVKLKS